MIVKSEDIAPQGRKTFQTFVWKGGRGGGGGAVGTNSPLLYKRRLKFGDFVACKADVFCRANDLDVETDREIRRVSKMIPRGRLTVQNNGVGREEKIRERFLPAPPFLVFQLIS